MVVVVVVVVKCNYNREKISEQNCLVSVYLFELVCLFSSRKCTTCLPTINKLERFRKQDDSVFQCAKEFPLVDQSNCFVKTKTNKKKLILFHSANKKIATTPSISEKPAKPLILAAT